MSAQTSNTAPAAPPRIEALLQTAYEDVATLQRARARLAGRGIAAEHLPSDGVVQCFALLGDHDRAALIAKLAPLWGEFNERGLLLAASGEAQETCTPLLRLYAHIQPQIASVANFWSQLEAAVDSVPPPAGWLVCPTLVHGSWGQRARIAFSVPADCLSVLVLPGPIFGLAPSMLATPNTSRFHGHITLPVDDGDVEIRALTATNTIYATRIRAEYAKASK